MRDDLKEISKLLRDGFLASLETPVTDKDKEVFKKDLSLIKIQSLFDEQKNADIIKHSIGKKRFSWLIKEYFKNLLENADGRKLSSFLKDREKIFDRFLGRFEYSALLAFAELKILEQTEYDKYGKKVRGLLNHESISNH